MTTPKPPTLPGGTAIEWAHYTFNPWRGCAKVSPGCAACYAESWAIRYRRGEIWGPHARRELAAEDYWQRPYRWNRLAERTGERARVFCASLADVFEDRPDLDIPRARLFRLIEQTPWLDWLLLTKRPHNMFPLAVAGGWAGGWPENVWAGTSAEDQHRLDERAQELLQVPAAIRFLSLEPLLSRVDVTRHLRCTHPSLSGGRCHSCAMVVESDTIQIGEEIRGALIDWLIIGGESGRLAREMDLMWVRDILTQARSLAGYRVAVFVKQLGSNPVGFSQAEADVYLEHPSGKGGDTDGWPPDLRVRDFPKVIRRKAVVA